MLRALKYMHTGHQNFVEHSSLRCRFSIDLADPTGTISATIFGKVAEEIFDIDALKLMQFSDKEGNDDFVSMGNLKTTSAYYFQVKPHKNKANEYIIITTLAELQRDDQVPEAT